VTGLTFLSFIFMVCRYRLLIFSHESKYCSGFVIGGCCLDRCICGWRKARSSTDCIDGRGGRSLCQHVPKPECGLFLDDAQLLYECSLCGCSLSLSIRMSYLRNNGGQVLLMRIRIKATGFSDWDSMFYNNFLSIPVLAIFSLVFENWSSDNVVRNFPPETRSLLLSAIAFSGAAAVGISVSAWSMDHRRKQRWLTRDGSLPRLGASVPRRAQRIRWSEH
jgi:hypothetical protein